MRFAYVDPLRSEREEFRALFLKMVEEAARLCDEFGALPLTREMSGPEACAQLARGFRLLQKQLAEPLPIDSDGR